MVRDLLHDDREVRADPPPPLVGMNVSHLQCLLLPSPSPLFLPWRLPRPPPLAPSFATLSRPRPGPRGLDYAKSLHVCCGSIAIDTVVVYRVEFFYSGIAAVFLLIALFFEVRGALYCLVEMAVSGKSVQIRRNVTGIPLPMRWKRNILFLFIFLEFCIAPCPGRELPSTIALIL